MWMQVKKMEGGEVSIHVHYIFTPAHIVIVSKVPLEFSDPSTLNKNIIYLKSRKKKKTWRSLSIYWVVAGGRLGVNLSSAIECVCYVCWPLSQCGCFENSSSVSNNLLFSSFLFPRATTAVCMHLRWWNTHSPKFINIY